jgi:hypothetical protein
MTNVSYPGQEIRRLLLLRAVVASLGERMTPPWWRTQFLTDVGLRAVSRVFPRTAMSAALGSVTIAALADHDKRIGVGGRYHLFSLPGTIEHALGLAMSKDSFQFQVAALIAKGQDALIEELTAIANHKVITSAEGPVRIGSPRRVLETARLEELAAHYRTSFETSDCR